MNTILIIDDDEMIRDLLKNFFEEAGFVVELAARADQGWERFLETNPFVVIVDQILPDEHGTELLKRMKKYDPHVHVIIITGYGEIKDAVRAMESGAMHYLTKPISLPELKVYVDQAVHFSRIIKERDHHRKKLQVQVKGRWTPLLFNSQIMKEIFERCQEVANTKTTILLQGESGVGKGLFAHYIHQISDRANSPFIDVDCSAIPETLLESELFGYEPGAFTDAKRRKEGLAELANTGTLFLDEISGLPLTLQGKLLKVIEEKSFRKLGGTKETSIDVRIIVASNINLKESVERKNFREDLYYRISSFQIEIPPLRERQEDMIPLAKHFLAELSKELHKPVKDIEPAALDTMTKYDWPGNVRELRNTIEKAIIIAKNKTITVNDMGIDFLRYDVTKERKTIFYKEARRQFEQEILINALKQANGNQCQAARILGISRNALIRRIQKYHIDLLEIKNNLHK